MMSSILGLNKGEQPARFQHYYFAFTFYGLACVIDGFYKPVISSQEYYDLLHEFMSAVKQNYGEKVLIQVSLKLDYIFGYLII